MGREVIALPPTLIRVRYSDVDRMGLLYHVNYLEYFEVARADWIRSFWRPYKEIEDGGLALVVMEAHISYLSPARYDDELSVSAELSRWGRSRLAFDYRIVRHNEAKTLCTGRTAHCFIDREGKPARIPDDLRRRLEQACRASD